jgi:hypothetical protein
VQHLLNLTCWDTEGVAADLRGFVAEHLGEPDGVLIVDESGDLKKGEHTVGVQRQYTGAAGRTRTRRSRSISPTPPGPAGTDRPRALPTLQLGLGPRLAHPDRRTAAGVPQVARRS